MSDILIRGVQIVHKASPFHLQRKNIRISKGIIAEINDSVPAHDGLTVIDAENACVSIGFCDMFAATGETGFEQKETIDSFCAAATAGGFTALAVLPNVLPVRQHKEGISFLKEKSKHHLPNLYAIAALSEDLKGAEMTEMLDLHAAGAVAFSDGWVSNNQVGLLAKTLQYSQLFDGLIMNMPDEPALTAHAQMHESDTSVVLGMKGFAAVAEQMHVARFLKLLEYTGGRLHFSCISTAETVALIAEAKQKGLQVTCDIAAHQLAFTDRDLVGFDTNFKVKPPFRSAHDQAALLQGLANDTIDAIVSAHCPQDEESKKLEFDLAEFGAIGLQTAFAAAHTHKGTLPLEKLIEKMTTRPRQILKLPMPDIAVGQVADLVLFNPIETWTLHESDILSLSKNSPFIGRTLQGRIKAVFNKGLASIF